MAKIAEPAELMYTNAEPKVAFRFLMDIEGIPTFEISKTDRPKVSSDTITLPHVNVEHYVKGKTKWSPVNVNLIDFITPSAAQAAMEWVRLGHESITGRDGYHDMYSKDVTIRVLGPIGDVVEEWTLKAAWVGDCSPDALDWNGGEVLNISLTLVYNYAILQY